MAAVRPARIRELTGGEDPDIVFEHPGREHVRGERLRGAASGGTVVDLRVDQRATSTRSTTATCGCSLKRILGSHFANYREAYEANRLVALGMIHPTLSRVYPLEEVGQAAYEVHQNVHAGKVGVRCLAPQDGLGVRDHAMAERLRPRLDRFRER